MVPPVVRLHGGHMGEPVGERSAGFLQFVDGVEAYTHRNLVARLFVNKPDIGGRLIRMGSLHSLLLREGTNHVGPSMAPSPPGDTRTPPERERDGAAYVHMVALANYARAFGLSLVNTQAVVVQALHLAEVGNHALVGTVTSVVRNNWLKHTVSATNKGRKTTLKNYSGAVAGFCKWAAEKYGDDISVMPVTRTMVVTFLEAEKSRRVVLRKRARPDGGEESDGGSSEEDVDLASPPPRTVQLIADGESGPSGASAVAGGGEDIPRPPETVGVRTSAAGGLDGLARPVGPQVLLNTVNALSKIASTLNLLFRDATCECCSRWMREEYAPAGSYAPAVAVVKQRKREKVLQDQAVGASKALGRRNPSVTDAQREEVVRRLLLLPTTATQHRLKALLAALFVLCFSLEARGATARGVVWSDVVVRQFPAMFSANGKALNVLCTYILATKTTEGITHCIGSLPHVNPWLCPVGATADALVAVYHRPGLDSTRPPVSFAPVFSPSEELLVQTGIDPAAFRAAGEEFGARPWYRLAMFPAAQGGAFKEMPYGYHNDHIKATLVASGVPLWAASTHLCRRAAAQKGKEAGASESDNKQQGLWSTSMAKGAYDAPIPNAVMTLGLSGRPLTCSAPITPRLEVDVPDELQRTICPWLEEEEAAYAKRVEQNRWNTDEALVNHFQVIRWVRTAYFQTWAARLASGGVPDNSFIHRHPLLSHALFPPFAAILKATLANVTQAAADAVEELIPKLGKSVESALLASAVSATKELQRHEEHLMGRLNASVSEVNMRAQANTAAIIAAGASAQQATSAEVAALREEVAQLRTVLSGFLPQRAAMALAAPCGTTSAAAGAPILAVDVRPSSDAPAAPQAQRLGPAVDNAPASPGLPTVWLTDKQKVSELQTLRKLEGVTIINNGKRCVPLVGMEPNLSWEMALDEYALGSSTRISLREADQHFGSLWRLLEPDSKEKKRLTGLYSSRLPLYRAFEQEYAKRGRVVGVAGVLSLLKRKFPDSRRAKDVIKAMAIAYPAQTTRSTQDQHG